jgi:uncharacterized protein YcaQ
MGSMNLRAIDQSRLRRMAFGNQGLLQKQPFGRGLAGTLRTIRHLGYIQIDTISVVVRAHNHVLQSRVPNFAEPHIHQLLRERKIFEARFPVAAFRPIEEFRYTLLHARKWRARSLSPDDRATMARVLDRVRCDGPLRSRDFEDARSKSNGWWDWKPAKRALEQLFFQGDLMISNRDGFQKAYDLTERVLPSSIDTSVPSLPEFASHLIDSTLRAHGFAGYKSFASDMRHGAPAGRSLRDELKRRCDAGELEQFTNTNGNMLWADPAQLEQAPPRTPARAKILSPFDNAVTQRDRMQDIFGFDYQLECYVPEAKRRYGYFCLPIQYSDQLVGRMDCKSHRDQSRFEVKALYLEAAFASRENAERLAEPLARAIIDYARFDGCTDVVVTQSEPAFLQRLLTKSLKQQRRS